MIRSTPRITSTMAVLTILTLGLLLLARRPQAPAPDIRPTFAASAPAATLRAVEPPASATTTFAGLPDGARIGIVSAMRAAQPISSPAPESTPVAVGTFTTSPRFGDGHQALAVFNGGSVDQLEAAVSNAGASGAWVQDESGAYHLLLANGPEALRADFKHTFPKGFATATAVTVVIFIEFMSTSA